MKLHIHIKRKVSHETTFLQLVRAKLFLHECTHSSALSTINLVLNLVPTLVDCHKNTLQKETGAI